MIVGDFTGDGKLDIVYTVSIGSPGILVGRGDGTFDPPATLSVTFGSGPLVAGDFNGDGRLDVATTDGGNARVRVFPGASGGAFLAATNFNARTLPVSVAAADFDGDGQSELVVANQTDGTVSVFRGDSAIFWARRFIGAPDWRRS